MTILYRANNVFVLWSTCEEIGGDYWHHGHTVDPTELDRVLETVKGDISDLTPLDIPLDGGTVDLLHITQDLLSLLDEGEGEGEDLKVYHIWSDDEEAQA